MLFRRQRFFPKLAILLLFFDVWGVLGEMLKFFLENACESFEFEALREDIVGVILNQGLMFHEI